MERQTAHVWRRLSGDTNFEEYLAVCCAFADEVTAVIRAIEEVVGVDVQPMRAWKRAFAPRGEEVAIRVEDNHRVVSAIEHIHAVLAVNSHGCNVLELPPLWQFGPVFHNAISILSTA
jgi:hypothetical protein